MKKIALKSILWMILMMLVACTSVQPKKTEVSRRPSVDKVLLASGYSQLNKQHLLTDKQNGFAMMQVAKIDAYRALADLLYREKLVNGLLVADQVIKDEAFRVYSDLFLRTARVIDAQRFNHQQKVLLRLPLSPRFYECISSSVEVVSQCLKEDEKVPFTRIGYQQAKVEVVNVSCPECLASLSISGFSSEKTAIDRALLNYGLYDAEWSVNMAVKTMLNYIALTQVVFR